MEAESSIKVVERFRKTYGRRYEAVLDGGPPWDDCSDAAALLAVFQLEAMIANGGWPAVFYNRLSWAVPLSVQGYRLLGMIECAERCNAAMRAVTRAEAQATGEDFDSDAWLSNRLMQLISDEAWEALDRDWYELTSETYDRAAAYITQRWPPQDIADDQPRGAEGSALPSRARQDVEKLLNVLAPIAQKLLDAYGEFVPFGSTITTDGTLTTAPVHPDIQSCADVVEFNKSVFREHAAAGIIRACGVCYMGFFTQDDNERTAALFDLETPTESARVVLPYRFEPACGHFYDNILRVPYEPTVFRSRAGRS